MKILVISGSPRANGNCEILSDAFIKGAEESGNEVKYFRASRDKISPCLACRNCYKNGKPCVQDDAMNVILPFFDEADVVALATPFYFHNFSAQMYAFFNRLYAIGNTRKHIYPKKDVCLIVSSNSGRKEDFEPLFAFYNNMLLGYMGWMEKGRIIASGHSLKGAVKGTEFEKQAYELGKSFK